MYADRSPMKEKWSMSETGDIFRAGVDAIAAAARARESGQREILFESDRGRTCFFVTNGERVMMVLLNEPGDPGKHAVDSAARGSSSGYELSNGQIDEYADCDTVPWDAALQALRCLVDGELSPVSWQIDR